MTALVIADSKHKLLLARARDDNTVRHLFFVLFDLPFELSDIITNYAIMIEVTEYRFDIIRHFRKMNSARKNLNVKYELEKYRGNYTEQDIHNNIREYFYQNKMYRIRRLEAKNFPQTPINKLKSGSSRNNSVFSYLKKL